MTLKNKLIDYIRVQYKDSWLKNQGDPSKVVSILEKINPNALLIGFGRRFATYKRAHLLFTDLDRWLRSLTMRSSRFSSYSPVRLTRLMVVVKV